MMKQRGFLNRIIIVALAVCMLAVFAACGSTNTSAGTSSQTPGNLKEVKIGFPSAGSDWPGGVLGVAKEYGYIDEYLKPLGYKAALTPFTGAAPAIHEALAGNSLDYVVYAGFAGVLGKATGIDTTLLSVTGFTSTWELVASAKSGIKSIADLKGKKISYQVGASPQMYVIRVLKEAGYAADDVQSIIASIPDTISSLATGAVDAGVMQTGQETKLVAAGAKVIHVGFNADKNVYYEPTVFIARTAALKENPEVAVAIQKAMLKGWDKINGDVDGYFKLSAERSGYPLDVVMATADRDVKNSIPMNLDDKYINSLKSIQTFLLDNKIITQSIDFDKWMDKSIVEKAAQEYADEKK